MVVHMGELEGILSLSCLAVYTTQINLSGSAKKTRKNREMKNKKKSKDCRRLLKTYIFPKAAVKTNLICYTGNL